MGRRPFQGPNVSRKAVLASYQDGGGFWTMDAIGYGRMRDLGGLPDLLQSLAGDAGLARAFRDQDLPLALLTAPDATVPMRDILALYHRASEITGRRSFGLEASADVDISQHGEMGSYITQAPDLVRATTRFRAALPYYETGSTLGIEARGREVRIAYRNIYQDLVGWRHVGDFTLCVIADLVAGYLGRDWRPLRIETCYDEGPWIQDLEDHFGAPVRHGQRSVAIILDREAIRASARRPDTHDDWLVSLGDLRRLGATLPRTFPQIVENIVKRRLISGSADLDGAAAMLGLGPRTVQRRLGDHGLSYRDLVVRCRMRHACELLTEADAAIGKIARSLGYASTPQFIRAFKSRIGITPKEYRRSHFWNRAAGGSMTAPAAGD